MDEIQILLAITVLYITYRWYSRSGSATPSTGTLSSTSSNASSSPAVQRFNTLAETIPSDAVSQASSMFPQLGEREIRWEFVRTGRVRSLEVVVQGMLEERQQPIIPAGFLEPIAPPPASTTSNTTVLQKARYESLIDKLGLQKQVAEQDRELADLSASGASSEGKGKGTDRSMSERYRGMSMLEKRERMILDARRRIIEKDRQRATPV